MTTKKILHAALIASVFVSSCKKDGIDLAGTFSEPGSAIVVNEGNFTRNNGSLSYIDPAGNVQNNIFETINGIPLGDVIQSYSTTDEFGIICVNNSQKVEIVDARTLKSIATITDGTDYPRYALAVSNEKVYITNGSFTGKVLVVNMLNFTVDKEIAVGGGPEELVKVNNTVYVANSGGFGTDNTISVINTGADAEVSRITVGDNPTDIEKDAAGNLWVLCKGYVTYDPPTYEPNRNSAAKLVHINTTTNTVDKQIELIAADNDWSAADNLEMGNNGNTLYFSIDDNVYQMPASSSAVPGSPLFKKYLYGLEIHPSTNEVWALDAGTFSSGGFVFRYSVTGVKLDSLKVGIGPNFIYFN